MKKIKEILNLICNEDNGKFEAKESSINQLEIYLVEKEEEEGKINYITIKPEINKKISKKILSKYIKNLNYILEKDYSRIEYDIDISLSKEKKIMTLKKIFNLNNILKSIENFSSYKSEINFKNLKLFVIKIAFDKDVIYFFEEFKKTMKLDKNFLTKITTGDSLKFDEVREEQLSLKFSMPCFYFGQEMSILAKFPFEKIFDYIYDYQRTKKDNQDKINNLNILSDSSKFFEEIKEDDINKLRKFASIINKGYYSKFTIDKIKTLCKENDLGSKIIIKNNKIDVEKSRISTILKILNDDYLESKFTGNKYATNSKERTGNGTLNQNDTTNTN